MKKNLTNFNNRDLIKSLFVQIESEGFHIKDEEFSNSYFVFEDDEDTICHFHIKEIPGFLFGLWNTKRFDPIEKQLKDNNITWAESLEINPRSELVFFTQYERDIDKFKPSRSGFVIGLRRDSWEEQENDGRRIYKEEWLLNDLLNILKYMKKHKIKSVEYAGCQTRYIWEDDRSFLNIFLTYIKDWIYVYKTRIKEKRRYKKDCRLAKKVVKKLKTYLYTILDFGDNCYPRVHVNLRRGIDIDYNDYIKDNNYLDRILKNKKYNNISFQFWEVEIDRNSTEEDLLEDKRLKEKFYKNYKEYFIKRQKKDIKVLDHSAETIEEINTLLENI